MTKEESEIVTMVNKKTDAWNNQDVNNLQTRQHFMKHTLMETIAGLNEESQPHWGKMTAQQMVEHLIWAFELSNGKSKIICNLSEEQEAQRKPFLYNNRPTPREVPNPELENGFPPNRFINLEEARKRLGKEILAFMKQDPENHLPEYDHPIFGKLNREEWERAHYKHTFHHLIQFGLIPDPDQNE